MKKRVATNESIKKEIERSKEYSEKFGKHTDKLGIMMIEVANIVIKSSNITSVSSHDLQDIKQEMCIEMLWVVNRYCNKGIMPDYPFNVFVTCCKRCLFENISKIKVRLERDKLFAELAKEINEEEKEYEKKRDFSDDEGIWESSDLYNNAGGWV